MLYVPATAAVSLFNYFLRAFRSLLWTIDQPCFSYTF